MSFLGWLFGESAIEEPGDRPGPSYWWHDDVPQDKPAPSQEPWW